jgi:hypothetical protein
LLRFSAAMLRWFDCIGVQERCVGTDRRLQLLIK